MVTPWQTDRWTASAAHSSEQQWRLILVGYAMAGHINTNQMYSWCGRIVLSQEHSTAASQLTGSLWNRPLLRESRHQDRTWGAELPPALLTHEIENEWHMNVFVCVALGWDTYLFTKSQGWMIFCWVHLLSICPIWYCWPFAPVQVTGATGKTGGTKSTFCPDASNWSFFLCSKSQTRDARIAGSLNSQVWCFPTMCTKKEVEQIVSPFVTATSLLRFCFGG